MSFQFNEELMKPSSLDFKYSTSFFRFLWHDPEVQCSRICHLPCWKRVNSTDNRLLVRSIPQSQNTLDCVPHWYCANTVDAGNGDNSIQENTLLDRKKWVASGKSSRELDSYARVKKFGAEINTTDNWGINCFQILYIAVDSHEYIVWTNFDQWERLL